MHTDHSHDCATPVEVLLATAAERGLGAIAVTDHNEVSGALDAERKAAQFGVRIAESQYWLATNGTTRKATASTTATEMRSCRIGKTCWSFA